MNCLSSFCKLSLSPHRMQHGLPLAVGSRVPVACSREYSSDDCIINLCILYNVEYQLFVSIIKCTVFSSLIILLTSLSLPYTWQLNVLTCETNFYYKYYICLPCCFYSIRLWWESRVTYFCSRHTSSQTNIASGSYKRLYSDTYYWKCQAYMPLHERYPRK